MEKSKIYRTIFVVVLTVICFGAGVLTENLTHVDQCEVCSESVITQEFVDTYLINCQSVGIEGKPYTICEQKIVD